MTWNEAIVVLTVGKKAIDSRRSIPQEVANVVGNLTFIFADALNSLQIQYDRTFFTIHANIYIYFKLATFLLMFLSKVNINLIAPRGYISFKKKSHFFNGKTLIYLSVVLEYFQLPVGTSDLWEFPDKRYKEVWWSFVCSAKVYEVALTLWVLVKITKRGRFSFSLSSFRSFLWFYR